MYSAAVLATLSFLAGASAQQVGTLTTETHPSLSISVCTSSGCTIENDEVVLDANWRWVHDTAGSTNCYTGNTWDSTLCPDAATCTTNCAVDGADYSGTYGITSSNDSLTLAFVTGSNVGSRTYLMDSETTYKKFELLNQEFTFDVDVSTLPCGLNGALYFVPMDADGGMSKYSNNKAGAKYGTGYCDAQCPKDLKFINGTANSEGWTPEANSTNSGTGNVGSCCSEMDVWEANSMANAVTPHACTVSSQTACTGTDCTANTGICDAAGCDFNPYRMGNTTFFGKSMTLDTTKVFTVVTQFITDDGTANGTLSEIKRFYVQDGITYAQPSSDISGVSGNTITDDFCTAQKTAFGDTDYFGTNGGMATMGDAMANGMVLVMSIWDDYSASMLWLDSDYPLTKSASSAGVARGTCATTSGLPSDVESSASSAAVTFSNIKIGSLGSTFTAPASDSSTGTGSSSAAAVASSSAAPVAASSAAAVVASSSSAAVAVVATSSAAQVAATSAVVVASSAAPVVASSSATAVVASSSSVRKCSSVTPATSVAAVATSATATSTAAASSSSSTGNAIYTQCGGTGFTGETTCASGLTCTLQNDYYSQCL
ncbi:glucanase-4 [Coleophoma crateriformis]|uniref:Glucanase n=1 Tax=Coleophoma crateriformis TaxID=565419 RepID=A0A3D8Q646_9HELO|nr:glucanase-4 [Coleophoma crateriformis]